MRESECVCVCVCVSAALNRERGVKNDRKGMEREQEKHKALSSENADRLTGLLRPTETNI